ncbi:unnamed protein product [Ixodes hexagonus]
MVVNTDSSISTRLGDSIQDYEVFNFLGKGGFAQVYRARSRNCGLEVAIKMVDKSALKRMGVSSTRVQQEVAIHSRLKHPSVVELFNYFEDREYVYLVIEYCEGGELQGYLQARRGPLTEPEASQLLGEIVSGILYLHSHCILHRDLSLSNLLLTRDLHVKIADFGLATQLKGPWERHTTLCGTPNFMSPEVASRDPHGLEADVWSLGVMLHTFLLGRPPAQGCSFEVPTGLSTQARLLLVQLLQRDPQQRIPLRRIPEQAFMLQAGCPLRPLPSSLGPPKMPLNTTGLRPASLWARNMRLSILEDGQVSVEFRGRNHKVNRVLRVSPDGVRVTFYKPPLNWHHSTEGVAPVPPQSALVHSWDALPQALWAKYACAARFVSLVRQKTPKIILYAEYALCILLGSGDLEASFYSGAKVVCSGNHVQLTDVGGPLRHLTLPVDTDTLSPSQCSLWQITCEYHRRCRALEAALEATDEGWNIFPAIFGRRPQDWRQQSNVKSPGSCCFSKDFGDRNFSPMGTCLTGTCSSARTRSKASLAHPAFAY